MTEETAGAETLAAESNELEATVDTSEATTEQPSEAENESEASASETTGEQSGDDAAAKPKKKHWAHERIDELTRQRREAEREAEYWKQRASSTVDLDNLDYEDGLAERISQRHRKEQADTASETVQRLAAETFSYRETEARERYQDYDAVTRNPNVPITEPMAEIIRDSDIGPEIAYHLGKNPVEAAKIAALSPNRQAVELGKLEVRLNAPKPEPKSPAAPVKPISGVKTGGNKSPDDMTMSEYIAARKAGKI